MTGRFVVVVAALCVAAWAINRAPWWSVCGVVIALGLALSLVHLDRKWERERRHRPIEPVKGRQR